MERVIDKNEMLQAVRHSGLQKYWPLAALVLVSALVATAFNVGLEGMQGWMHGFMGFSLSVFALLKLFHPVEFADAFERYDLLGKRSRAYAYTYPVLELMLGLGFLSFAVPTLVYVLTIVVMVVGSAGVISALREGLDINCPCMGTVLKVPLSTVTLVENITMAVMALALLIY